MLKRSLLNTSLMALIPALLLMGCAKEEFRKQIYEESSSSVGFRYLPAKVDIVIVPDNTDSANNAMPIIQGQLNSMVSSMQGKFWDYHLAKSDMILPTQIKSVLVNPTFNTNTLSDGTTVNNTGIVPLNAAVTNASQFSLNPVSIYSPSMDNTFSYLINNLNLAKNDRVTNFLRDDAMLAVVVITNGCEGSIDQNCAGNINTATVQNYATQLAALKGGSTSLIRFYPVAAYGYRSGNNGDYCLTPGSTSKSGASYFAMNNIIKGLPQYSSGGEVLNLCNATALQNVLTGIEQNLDKLRQSYIFSRIVLTDPAAPLTVTKNGIQLNQSLTDGWEYKGFQSNVPTVTGIYDEATGTSSNVSLNVRSGYVIELHGSAMLRGNDTYNVTYTK